MPIGERRATWRQQRLRLALRAPAQKLESFENKSNEDVLAHPCGEFVLEQLQSGVSASDVVRLIRERYLVEAKVERVNAYRKYREQKGEYWTSEKLEHLHWDKLYSLVSLEKLRQELLSEATDRENRAEELVQRLGAACQPRFLL